MIPHFAAIVIAVSGCGVDGCRGDGRQNVDDNAMEFLKMKYRSEDLRDEEYRVVIRPVRDDSRTTPIDAGELDSQD
ncbi:MAG: hypothetical protein K8W52_13995 [Deltaproteobacteria bacterium]|nr:hypothetical protein [Deltaproteobacteria bacterium]